MTRYCKFVHLANTIKPRFYTSRNISKFPNRFTVEHLLLKSKKNETCTVHAPFTNSNLVRGAHSYRKSDLDIFDGVSNKKNHFVSVTDGTITLHKCTCTNISLLTRCLSVELTFYSKLSGISYQFEIISSNLFIVVFSFYLIIS